jgi:predicted outer membrane repeat protein
VQDESFSLSSDAQNQKTALNQVNKNNEKNPNKSRKTKKIILSAVIVCLAITIGIIVGVVFLSRKTFTVSFVTGPFEDEDNLQVEQGSYFKLPTVSNKLSDDGTMTIATFTGWFTDEDLTEQYVRGPVQDNLTLYAGYTVSDLTFTFYAENDYNDDGGYIFLGTISEPYYTGTLNFDDIEATLSAMNASVDGTTTYANGDYLFKATSDGVLSTQKLPYTKQDYTTFLSNYFTISSLENQTASINLQAGESLSTPSNNLTFLVGMTQKDIVVNFNSNLQSVKNDYVGTSYANESYADEVKSISMPYGTNYTFVSFTGIGYDAKIPAYHSFKGWSLVDPEVDENGVVQNTSYSNNVFSYGEAKDITRIILQNQTEVTFYAVWEQFSANLIIYTDYGVSSSALQATVTAGTPKSVSQWVSADIADLNKTGFALVGLNSKADQTGLALNLDTNLQVDARNTDYYDSSINSIVLYAVYKKIVSQTNISLNDDSLDAVSIDESNLQNLFAVDLNLGSDEYEYDNADQIAYSFDSENGVIEITNLIVGALLTLPVVTRFNYNLGGYEINSQTFASNSTYQIAESDLSGSVLDVDVVWQGVDATLFVNTFLNAEGQMQQTSVGVVYGENLVLTWSSSPSTNTTTVSVEIAYQTSGVAISSFKIVREGYDFVGFFASQDGLESLPTSFCVNSSFENVYAVWQIQTYSVVFNLNGGSYNSRTDSQNVQSAFEKDIEYNSTITLLSEDDVTFSGYYLEGWSEQNDTTAQYGYDGESVTVTDNLTLYAVWTVTNYVELFIDADGSSTSKIGVSREGNYVLTGEEFDDSTHNYDFSVFNSNADGSGKTYLASTATKTFGEDDPLSEDGNLQLYAMFFVVSYDNGDSSGDVNVSGENPSSTYLAYGASLFSLPDCSYTYSTYYNFAGWTLDGSVITSLTADEATTGLTFSDANVLSSVSIVAKWSFKDVLVKVFSNISKISLAYSSTVTADDERLVSVPSSLTTNSSGNQLDFVTDGTTSAFYCYENTQGAYQADIVVPEPNASMTQSGDIFIYKVYCVWKQLATFASNNGSDDEQTVNVGTSYDTATYTTHTVPVSAIEVSPWSALEYAYKATLSKLFEYDYHTFSHYSATRNVKKYVSGTLSEVNDDLLTGDEIYLLGDTTFTANWENCTYTVNFEDTTGNNASSSVTVTYGTSYNFGDLLLSSSKLTQYFDSTSGRYLMFSSFVYSSGGTYDDIFSTDISVPFTTTIDATNQGIFTKADLEDDGEVTLQAYWQEKVYKIVVDLNGGTWTNTSNQTLNGGNATYGTDDFGNAYITYRRTYTELTSDSGVALLFDGLSCTTATIDDSVFESADSLGIVSGTKSTGFTYKFTGTAEQLEQLDSNTRMYVLWDEFFIVNFDANGGSTTKQSFKQYITTNTDENDDYISFEMTNDNATTNGTLDFAGWYYSKDLSVLSSSSLFGWGDTVTITRQMIETYGNKNTNVITLFAIWKATVTFAFDESTSDFPAEVAVTAHYSPDEVVSGDITFTQQFLVGTVFSASELNQYKFTLNVESFSFAGWTLLGTSLTGLTVSKNITLVASWQASQLEIDLMIYSSSSSTLSLGSYVLGAEFKAYSTDSDIDLNSAYLAYGNKTTLPFVFGYNFVGWRTDFSSSIVSTDESEDIFNATNLYSVGDYSVTLYAVYEFGTVYVTYNKNSATASYGTGSPVVVSSVTSGDGSETPLTYGSVYSILQDLDYTLDYCEIAGWKTSTSGEQVYTSTITLTGEDFITRAYDTTANKYIYKVTLYAQWTRQIATITIDLDGGTTSTDALDDYYVNSGTFLKSYSLNGDEITLNVLVGTSYKLPSLQIVSKTNYQLDHFEDSAGNTYAEKASVVCNVKQSVTLTAVWVSIITIKVYANTSNTDTDYVTLTTTYGANVTFTTTNGVSKINDTVIDFSKEHYSLSSYNKQKNGSGDNFSISSVKKFALTQDNFYIDQSNTTSLYCQWLGDLVTVVVNMNDDGGVSGVTSRVTTVTDTYRYGDNINLFEDFYATDRNSRADGNVGYVFDYYTDSNGTEYDLSNKIFSTSTFGYQSGYIFNAHWTPAYFKVTFNFLASKFSGTYLGQTYSSVDSISVNVAYNSTVSYLDVTVAGNSCVNYLDENSIYPVYVFDGYTNLETQQDVTGAFVMPAKNVDLNILWQSKQFVLEFDPSGSAIGQNATGATYALDSSATYDYALSIENKKLEVSGLFMDSTVSLENLPAPTNEGFSYSYYYLLNSKTYQLVDESTDEYNVIKYNADGTFVLSYFGLSNDQLNFDEFWDADSNVFRLLVSVCWETVEYTVNYEMTLPSKDNGYSADATGSLSLTSEQLAGSTETFTYDTASTLFTGYTLFGWTQIGWTTKENYTEMQQDSSSQYLFSSGVCETAQVYNFSSTEDASVSLYPIWQQNEYVFYFKDDNSADVNTITFLYDGVYTLAELFSSNAHTFATTAYDSTNDCYVEFSSWQYTNSSNVSTNYSTTESLVFSCGYGGFIDASDFDDGNTISVLAVWGEISYTLRFNLLGGIYNSSEYSFQYTNENDANGYYRIVSSVKYSLLSSGVSLADLLELDEGLLIYNDDNGNVYTFAGWAFGGDLSTLSYPVLTDTSDANILVSSAGQNLKIVFSSPNSVLDADYVFVFNALWNCYKVTVDGVGGLASNVSYTSNSDGEHIALLGDVAWTIEDDFSSVYTYTYYKSNIVLSAQGVYSWFAKDNYHVESTENDNLLVTEDATQQVPWTGNLRYVVLYPNDNSATLDYSSYPDKQNTILGYADNVIGYVETTSPTTSSFAYSYNSSQDTGAFSAYTSTVEGVTYYDEVSNGLVIIARYGDTITSETLSSILVSRTDGSFEGWTNGTFNFSTMDLVIGEFLGQTDDELIILTASWDAVYVSYNLNGGTYNGSQTIDKTSATLLAGVYSTTIPSKYDQESGTTDYGPTKFGYEFLGWSYEYKTYDAYVASGDTSGDFILPTKDFDNLTYSFKSGDGINSRTLNAIWSPIIVTFQFISGTDNVDDSSFTLSAEFGSQVVFPTSSNATVATWVNSNSEKVFSYWQIIVSSVSTAYEQGYAFQLTKENLNVFGSTADISTKNITVYGVWLYSKVTIKIKLGTTGDYKYFGTDGVLNVSYDNTLNAKCFVITNKYLNEIYTLPTLSNIYSFGKCAVSYLAKNNQTLTDGSLTLIGDYCTENDDGTYTMVLTVVWQDAVCYIDNYYSLKSGTEKFFYSFDSALESARTDSSIATKATSEPYTKIVILNKQTTLSLASEVDIDNKVVLALYDSADHSTFIVTGELTINRSSGFSGDYVFNISSGGTLEFEESESGTFLLSGTSSTSTKSFIKVSGGKLVLCKNLTISNCTNSVDSFGGAIYAESGATVTINDSIFTSNTVSTTGSDIFGGAIYADNSTVVVNGGTFSGNSVVSSLNAYGGAIAVVNNTSLMLGNSKFTSNSATAGNGYHSYGGAVYVQNSYIEADTDDDSYISFVTSDDGVGNSAEYGGSIALVGNASTSGGSVQANVLDNLQMQGSLARYGGAIYVSNSTTDFASGDFSINLGYFEDETETYGGAIYADKLSVLTFENMDFYMNFALYGAVIYSQATSIVFTTCDFYYNYATTGFGGAIYVKGYIEDETTIYSRLQLLGCTLTSNYAQNGGAIYVGELATLLTDEVTVHNDTTDEDVVTETTIKGNQGTCGAGIFFASTTPDTENYSSLVSSIQNTLFVSNASRNSESEDYSEEIYYGGAIYMASGALNLGGTYTDTDGTHSNVSFYSNGAHFGGAIYVLSGEVNILGADIGIKDVQEYDNSDAGDSIDFSALDTWREDALASIDADTTLTDEEKVEAKQGVEDEYVTKKQEIIDEVTQPTYVTTYRGNYAYVGGGLCVDGGSVNFVFGNILGNTTYANAGAIYNAGSVKLQTVTILKNTSVNEIIVYNSGDFEMAGDVTVGESQKFFIQFVATDEQGNKVNEYKYITVSGGSFTESSTSIVIDFSSDDFVLGKPIVKFTDDTLFGEIYALYEDGYEPFQIYNEVDFILVLDTTQKALVLGFSNYSLFYRDISSEGDELNITGSSTFVYNQTVSQQEFLDKTLEVTPSREGYSFVGWAICVTRDDNGNITDFGRESDVENVEIYDIIADASTSEYKDYFQYVSKVGYTYETFTSAIDGLQLPNHNLYIYAVWQPNEFSVVYLYDTEFDNYPGTTSYTIGGEVVDDNAFASLNQTAYYGKSFTLASLDEINSVEFIHSVAVSVTYSSSVPVSVTYNSTVFENITLDETRQEYYFVSSNTKYYISGSSSAYYVFGNEIVSLSNDDSTKDARIYPQHISFVDDGGETVEEDISIVNNRYTFTYNTVTYTMEQNYRPDNYSFKYYVINGNVYSLSQTLNITKTNADTNTTNGIIYVTVYFQKMNIVVNINNNGGTDASASFALSENMDATISLPQSLSSTKYDGVERYFYKKGYTLLGFSYSSDATTATFEAGAEFTVTETSSGTITLYAVWTQAVCYVQGVVSFSNNKLNVYYTSLNSAMTDIKNHIFDQKLSTYNVFIMSSVTLSSTVEVTDNISIFATTSALTVSPTQDFSASSSLFDVKSGSTLLLSAGSSNGIAYTVANYASNSGEYTQRQASLICVETGATLKVLGITIQGANNVSNGGAVFVSGSAEFEDVLFVSNVAGNGGAIYLAEDSTVEITDCYFGGKNLANTASANGGAIYACDGTHLSITGESTFAYNSATKGGAIYLEQNVSDVVLSSTVFSSNSASSMGGAIYVSGDLTLGTSTSAKPSFDSNKAQFGGAIYACGTLEVLFGETFTNNIATVSGGAIYSLTNLVVKNATFESNTANGANGGAIYATNSVSLNSDNCENGEQTTFIKNSANESGGALYAVDAQVSVCDVLFGKESNGNSAYYGGAICVTTDENASSTLSVDGNTVITMNYSKNSVGLSAGGGIYVNNTTLALNATVSGNTMVNGGGVYATGSSSVILGEGAVVSDNTATYGAGMFIGGSSSILFATADVSISSNEAYYVGGGIYFVSSNTSSTLENGSIEGNSAGSAGAGIYLGTQNSGSASTLTLDGVTLTGNIFDNSGIYEINSATDAVGEEIFVDKNCTLKILSGTFYGSIGINSSTEDSSASEHATLVIGKMAYVAKVYVKRFSSLQVSSELSNAMYNENLTTIYYVGARNLEINEILENDVVVNFASLSVLQNAQDLFVLEMVDSTMVSKYNLDSDDDNLTLFVAKVAEYFYLVTNGGELSFDSTVSYEEEFDEDGNLKRYKVAIDTDDTYFDTLSHILGTKLGYEMSDEFLDTNGKPYTADSILPVKVLTLSPQWIERIFTVFTTYENASGQSVTTNLGTMNYFGGKVLTAPSIKYCTFTNWELCYVQNGTYVKTGITYQNAVKFMLSSLSSTSSLSPTLQISYSEVYDRIIELGNSELYFVGNFTWTTVTIEIDANGGQTNADNSSAYTRESGEIPETTWLYTVYQKDLYVDFINFIDDFSYAGHTVVGLFTGSNSTYDSATDTLYSDSNSSIKVDNISYLKLHCQWIEVTAYIKKAQTTSTEPRLVYYQSLSDATNALSNGDTLVLVKTEIQVSGTITINRDVTLTTNSSVKLTRANAFAGYILSIGGNVTVETTSSLTIDGDNIKTAYGAILVSENGTLTLGDGVVVENNITTSQGGAVKALGVLVISGATIQNNSASMGAGVYSTSGLTINSGTTITGNTATYGGGIYVASSSFVMNGGEISENVATYGAGIYFASTLSGAMLDGAISLNTATYGGGVYLALNCGLFTFGAGVENESSFAILSNTATYGGGIYVDGNSTSSGVNASINGVTIKDNTATYGGGICVGDFARTYAKQIVELVSGTVKDNTATYGGGVAVYRGRLNVSGGEIFGNSLLESGKGSDLFVGYSGSAGVVDISGGTVGKANSVGSIYVDTTVGSGELYLSGTYQVLDSVTLCSGALIYVVENIDSTNEKVVVNLTDYSSVTSGGQVQVAKFADNLTCTADVFDVSSEFKSQTLGNNLRVEAVDQFVVITKAFFTLTIDANGGELVSNLSGYNFEQTEDEILVQVPYLDSLSNILSAFDADESQFNGETKISAQFDNRYFIEWNTSVDGDDDSVQTMPYQDLTVYAIWTQVYYVLTIDLNDTKGVSGTTAVLSESSQYYAYLSNGKVIVEVFTDSTSSTFGASVIEEVGANLSRTGYTVQCFSDSQLSSGNKYALTNSTFKMPSTDTTLYVLWQANTYSINYHSNNTQNESEIVTYSFDEYAYLESKDLFSLAGYTATTWSTLNVTENANLFDFGQRILNLTTEDSAIIDFYCIWTANTYTVLYLGAVSGKTVTGTVEQQTATYGEQFSLQTATFTLAGYHQVGWTANDETYSLGQAVENLTTDTSITLLAVWQQNSYQVELFASTSSNSPLSISTYLYDSETEDYLPYVKDLVLFEIDTQHYFVGWTTKTDSTSSQPELADHAQVLNLTTDNGVVIKLYGMIAIRTITVDANNGTDVNFVKECNADGSRNHNRTGTHFGWYILCRV